MLCLDQTSKKFLDNLNVDHHNLDQCRYIWRKIVLQCVLDPSIASPGAKWLVSYAQHLPRSNLQHAKNFYVALNLLLYGYGTEIFRETISIDVFKTLDYIGHLFEEKGNQSKQFSPKHKMAQVWGTAAIAYSLASNHHKYLVCASIMRASFELLGIRFPSSGTEPLYLLASKHAPDFVFWMTHDPSIKITWPECLNYFRQKLKNTANCITYSTEAVNKYVSEVFNIDLTSHMI